MKALVTGAAGHLGLNLCRALVARPGFEVRASVRSLADRAKAEPVRAMGALEVVELDVRNARQFDAALDGVDTLFHVAATYSVYTGSAERDREMVRDSVEGVETALRAAARARLRKVVLTSSVVTLPLRRPEDPPATEADWQGELRLPYFRAKTAAEQLAWRLAEELGLTLVTILPGGIGGPGFLRRTPTIAIFEGIMLGAMRLGAPNGNFTYVDVRDVATAHILAAEKDVSGRFAVCNDEQPSFIELTRLMHGIDPKVPAARFVLPSLLNPVLPLFDRLNARLLGSPRVLTPEAAALMDGRVYKVDTARARERLAWRPSIPIAASLEETMGAIRNLRRAESLARPA